MVLLLLYGSFNRDHIGSSSCDLNLLALKHIKLVSKTFLGLILERHELYFQYFYPTISFVSVISYIQYIFIFMFFQFYESLRKVHVVTAIGFI